MATCCSVFGFLLLFAALVMCAVSFGTSYWVQNDDSGAHCGLWQFCRNVTGEESCSDLVGDDSPFEIETWFNIVRGLMAGALFFLLLDVIFATCYCCCNSCKAYRSIQLLVVDLVLIALATLLAVALFAAKSHDKYQFHWDQDKRHYSWSFFLALGAFGATVLSVICYIFEIPNARRVAAYEPIRPTAAS